MSELTDEMFSVNYNDDIIEEKDIVKLVVKVATSYWHDEKGLYSKKTIRFLKRKSLNYNILLEDSKDISSKQVYEKIKNLYEVYDGEYEVITVNHSYCRESGCLDDYDYKLIPYKDEART